MSEEEEGGFLSRWSRRKREARVQERRPDEATPAAAPNAAPEAVPAAAEEPVDPAELPPVDSLTAESDFTAFMRKGVPSELKTAALRKLWLSDPAIRDYKTLADYDWDFNAPGYGALLPTDDVKKLVDMVLKPRQPAPAPEADAASVADVAAADAPVSEMPEAAPEPAMPDTVRLTDPRHPVAELPAPAPSPRADSRLEGERIGADAPPDGDRQFRKRRHGGAIPS